MKAVILAAGEGTRLGPFTHSEPKGMIPVANRPILEYGVQALVESGLRDLVLVVGYRKERILSHFGDGRDFGARIDYAVQEKQLGTAHALLQAREHLDGDFVVLPGDNVIDARTVRDLLEGPSGPRMVITESERPSRYGVVTLKGGKVTDVVEKPEERIGNLINTGIYALPADFLDRCEKAVGGGILDLPALLQDLAREGTLQAIRTEGTWVDAVYPWDLIRVNAVALEALEERTAGKVEEGVVLRGPVSLGEGSVLRAGTVVQGPVAIGPNCDIGPHATVYPSTSIGENVTVGPSSVIEDSLIMADTSLGPFAYVSQGVLGKGIRAGSHLTAPRGAAWVLVEGEWHERPQVGSFLGEDAVLGSGVRVLPGTLLGARSTAGAGTTLRGTVPPGAQVV